jgi:Mn-dependent DtxR family transcriptional regulator
MGFMSGEQYRPEDLAVLEGIEPKRKRPAGSMNVAPEERTKALEELARLDQVDGCI